MNLDLTGKHAMVCGSTQGIGRASALELAKLGANIILVARNEERLTATLQELDTSKGQRHSFIQADFYNPEKLKAVVDQFLSTNPSPEILINNTGGPAGGQIIEEDYVKFQETMSAHLHCNHLLAQALAPGMKASGYGRIINIVSTSVYMPIPGLGVSNTVRGAVASWAKTLSIELGQYGITVNNVLPGFTKTSRLENIIDTKAAEMRVAKSEVIASMEGQTPAKRFGEAEEVASAVAFLASPAAGYINGVSVPVDGGKTGCI